MNHLELINLVDRASSWSEARAIVEANVDLLNEAFHVLGELIQQSPNQDEAGRLKIVQLYFERCLLFGVAHATAEQIAEVQCNLSLEKQLIQLTAGRVERGEVTLEDALGELSVVGVGADETNLLLIEGHILDILSDETLDLALLMAVLANALAPQVSTRAQARIALLLGGLQRRKGELAEALAILERAEYLSHATAYDLTKAMIAGELAQCFLAMGETKKAQENFELAASLSLQQDPSYARACLTNVADIFEEAGDIELAIAVERRALEAAQRASDSRAQAYSLGHLGDLLKKVGRKEEAREALRQAAEKSCEARDTQDEAWRSYLMGEALWPDDKEEALFWYREAVNLVPSETDWTGASLYLSVFGRHLRDERRYDEAQDVCRRAIALSHLLDDKHEEDNFRALLANVLLRQNRLEEAGEEYERALELSITEGDQIAQSDHLSNLADIQYRLGRVHEAVKYGDLALRSAKQIGDAKEEVHRLRDLVRFCIAEGDLIQSMAYTNQAIDLAEKQEDKRLMADVLMDAAQLLAASGLSEKALTLLQKALVISKEDNAHLLEIQVLKQLGEVLWTIGLGKEAINILRQGLHAARNENQPQLQLKLIEMLIRLDDVQIVWDEVESIGNQALAMCRSSGDKESITGCLECLGNIFMSRDPQRAIVYYEELAHQYKSQRQPYSLTLALSWLGDMWQNLGNIDKSIECYEQALDALATDQPIQFRALILFNLADGYKRLRRKNESQRYFDMASRLIEQNTSLNIFSEIAYLIQSRRGDFYFDYEKWEEAVEAYRLAVELLSRFFQIATTASVRSYWVDSGRIHYERLIRACLNVSAGSSPRRDKGKRAALEIVEEARSRLFIGQLGQTLFLIPSNLPGGWIEEESNALAGLRALEQENLDRFGKRFSSYGDTGTFRFINERLQHWNALLEIWAKIKASCDAGREYVTLRKGETVNWDNLVYLLAK